MPFLTYSWKLKRTLPMLSDEEFAPIHSALQNRIERMKEYCRTHARASLAEAAQHCCDDALDYYEKISGVRLAHPDQLDWVRLSQYGRLCPSCEKPLRTPRAKLCVACGFELPEGQIAGAATPPTS
ncbi:hypothetical protein [Vitreimonas sp.]|jgi:hypothetical protein|uniref:hypothetical protein n=1 Tax=Vitreimonas sp. TaxID=3069702 RepID=UPI002ED93BD2